MHSQTISVRSFCQRTTRRDLLEFRDNRERARLLIATGFLALGPKNLDEANASPVAADVIDEQIDAVAVATRHSIACARCHDHKTDPYTMEDYYSLAGIFASTKIFWYLCQSRQSFGRRSLASTRGGGQIVLQPSIPANAAGAEGTVGQSS